MALSCIVHIQIEIMMKEWSEPIELELCDTSCPVYQPGELGLSRWDDNLGAPCVYPGLTMLNSGVSLQQIYQLVTLRPVQEPVDLGKALDAFRRRYYIILTARGAKLMREKHIPRGAKIGNYTEYDPTMYGPLSNQTGLMKVALQHMSMVPTQPVLGNRHARRLTRHIIAHPAVDQILRLVEDCLTGQKQWREMDIGRLETRAKWDDSTGPCTYTFVYSSTRKQMDDFYEKQCKKYPEKGDEHDRLASFIRSYGKGSIREITDETKVSVPYVGETSEKCAARREATHKSEKHGRSSLPSAMRERFESRAVKLVLLCKKQFDEIIDNAIAEVKANDYFDGYDEWISGTNVRKVSEVVFGELLASSTRLGGLNITSLGSVRITSWQNIYQLIEDALAAVKDGRLDKNNQTMYDWGKDEAKDDLLLKRLGDASFYGMEVTRCEALVALEFDEKEAARQFLYKDVKGLQPTFEHYVASIYDPEQQLRLTLEDIRLGIHRFAG